MILQNCPSLKFKKKNVTPQALKNYPISYREKYEYIIAFRELCVQNSLWKNAPPPWR